MCAPYFFRRTGINFAFLAKRKTSSIRLMFVVDSNIRSSVLKNGQKLFSACLVVTVRICITMRKQLVKIEIISRETKLKMKKDKTKEIREKRRREEAIYTSFTQFLIPQQHARAKILVLLNPKTGILLCTLKSME